MKKLLWSLALVTTVVAGLTLTGCSAPSGQPATTPSAAKATAQPAPTTAPAPKASAAAAQPTPTQPPKPAAKEESLADLVAKAKRLEGYSVESTITANSVVASNKIFIQGKKSRIEQTAAGQNLVVIVDADTGTMYSYFPDQKQAMKLPLGNLAQAAGDTPSTPSDYLGNTDPTKAEVVETTTLDGVRARVLLFRGADGKESMRMWVREDYGIPAKVEVTLPDGSKSTIEYKNLKVGTQPADLFQIPSGVQITDMSSIAIPTPRKP